MVTRILILREVILTLNALALSIFDTPSTLVIVHKTKQRAVGKLRPLSLDGAVKASGESGADARTVPESICSNAVLKYTD
jgi:hypothetical protein